ncbi:hypothetical protein ABZ078_16090 [Streptomyces sp. NPDC006385]|uniref:hypothetical protein n=1 Tax=Streptomyces sp. NPDC006385 TaxID=3156761 RepID=UPI0033B77090
MRGTWSRRRFARNAAAGTAVVLGASSHASTSASAAPPRRADPPYDRPVIDSEKDLTTPVPHHVVSGHF